MRSTYRVLAYLVAVEVVIQAAAIVYFMFAVTKWVGDGASLTPAILNSSSSTFPGVAGLAIHWMNGLILTPLIALALLVVSFFAKVPDGTRWALYVLGLLVLQIALAFIGSAVPAISPLHGINALLLLAVAAMAGRRVSAQTEDAQVAQA